jgi:hypothetical protein
MLLAMPVETKQMDGGAALVVVTGRLTLGRDVERLEAVVNELLAQGQNQVHL